MGVVGDYVSSFFGLSDGNSWSMNAFDVRIYLDCFLKYLHITFHSSLAD